MHVIVKHMGVAHTSQDYRQLPQGRAKCRTGAYHLRSNTQLSSGTGVLKCELIAAAAGFDYMVLSVIGVSWLSAPFRSNHHAGLASASSPTESPPRFPAPGGRLFEAGTFCRHGGGKQCAASPVAHRLGGLSSRRDWWVLSLLGFLGREGDPEAGD